MCVFVCISHTCRNLNFAKNVTTLLHWADDMKCLINWVKNSSSKKKKIPTYLPYFCSACYANITISLFGLIKLDDYIHDGWHDWTANTYLWILTTLLFSFQSFKLCSSLSWVLLYHPVTFHYFEDINYMYQCMQKTLLC